MSPDSASTPPDGEVYELDHRKAGTEEDRSNMHRMGKTQELRRNFSFIPTFGFSAVLMISWEAMLNATSYSIPNGGLPAMIWMYVVSLFGMGAAIVSMAEMASMAPTSGGQYHWVSEFAPKKLQKVLSYIIGMFIFANQLIELELNTDIRLALRPGLASRHSRTIFHCGLTSTRPYSSQQERLHPSAVACSTSHDCYSFHRSRLQHLAREKATTRRGPCAYSPRRRLLCNLDTTLVCYTSDHTKMSLNLLLFQGVCATDAERRCLGELFGLIWLAISRFILSRWLDRTSLRTDWIRFRRTHV
jgi:hypothetical protein